MTWRDQAACQNADPDLFFPEPATLEHVLEVKGNYCDGCPVRQECLDEALADRSTSGIHGGMMFPLVARLPYLMELLRLEGWGWSAIAEHFGTKNEHTASALVSAAYKGAERRAVSGTQYIEGRCLVKGARPQAPKEPTITVRPKPSKPTGTSKEAVHEWTLAQRATGCSWADMSRVSGYTVKQLECRHRMMNKKVIAIR